MLAQVCLFTKHTLLQTHCAASASLANDSYRYPKKAETPECQRNPYNLVILCLFLMSIKPLLTSPGGRFVFHKDAFNSPLDRRKNRGLRLLDTELDRIPLLGDFHPADFFLFSPPGRRCPASLSLHSLVFHAVKGRGRRVAFKCTS